MTTVVLLLWAFLWNLVGAAIGIIPIGLIFLISKAASKIVRFIRGLI